MLWCQEFLNLPFRELNFENSPHRNHRNHFIGGKRSATWSSHKYSRFWNAASNKVIRFRARFQRKAKLYNSRVIECVRAFYIPSFTSLLDISIGFRNIDKKSLQGQSLVWVEFAISLNVIMKAY